MSLTCSRHAEKLKPWRILGYRVGFEGSKAMHACMVSDGTLVLVLPG